MLDQIRIVLVNTSHTGNMGSAARAMKTMGLTQLVLVDPQALPDEEAVALAAGASDILAGARIVAVYPMGPLIANTGLNLTVLSHDGQVDIGIIACPDLVDDVGELADRVVRAVADLVTLSDAGIATTEVAS